MKKSCFKNNLVALHFKYDQARRRFVEWAPNEIAVVPDSHKRILFSDEAHFWLNGYVNKQNWCIWSEANPQVYVETPLHPEKLTVWCALWAGGIIGPYFFKNDEGHNVTVNGVWYRAMISNFFIPELNNHDVQELWFQQDGATCHTARATIDLLKDPFATLGSIPIRDSVSEDLFFGRLRATTPAEDRFLALSARRREPLLCRSSLQTTFKHQEEESPLLRCEIVFTMQVCMQEDQLCAFPSTDDSEGTAYAGQENMFLGRSNNGLLCCSERIRFTMELGLLRSIWRITVLERMEWPARSSDLNPIEHLETILAEVAALNPPQGRYMS
ncbi:transposase [Trichonephila clavipes]|nr:transposase [Trichonephila clavipes]